MEKITVEDKKMSDDISLKEIIAKLVEWIRYILSKWIIIGLFGVVGGALGFFYARSKPTLYTAITTFVLEDGDKGGGLGQYAGLASMAGIDVGGGGSLFQGENILELYKSRIMVEKTLLTEVELDGKKQSLLERYIYFKKLREKWTQNPMLKDIKFNIGQNQVQGFRKINFTRVQDSVLGTIVNDIDKNYLKVTKPDKKLSIIYAEVKADDEIFAKSFNEQIVKNVNDFYVQTKTKKSLESVGVLQQKTDSVRSVMNGAIYSAASVTDATPNLNITRQAQRIAPVQRSQYSLETNKLMLSELLKNLELSKISLKKEAPLIQIIDQPVLPLEKQNFGKIKGLLIGGIIFGFLSIAVLIIRKIIKDVSL